MLLAASPLCMPAILAAQTKPRVARIGYLHLHTIEKKPTPERAAFLAGLRELGYETGRNLVIEYRGAEGDISRLPELAQELVKLRLDVMVVGSVEAAAAAKNASSAIPLVITAAGDPVSAGVGKTDARPGGNPPGVSFLSPPLGG